MAQRAVVLHAFFAVTGTREAMAEDGVTPILVEEKEYFTRENQHEALDKLSAEQVEAFKKSGSLAVYDDDPQPASTEPANRPSPAPRTRGRVAGVRPMQVDETEAK